VQTVDKFGGGGLTTEPRLLEMPPKRRNRAIVIIYFDSATLGTADVSGHNSLYLSSNMLQYA
jgi:hypothetical protein